MFLRKKKNKSGSVSVQIISKIHGRSKLIKTIGSAASEQEIQRLWYLGKMEIERLSGQAEIFIPEEDVLVEQVFSSLENAQIRTVGPELVFGHLFDSIGFNTISEALFRHLVIARLAFPLSKLKTIAYLFRYQGVLLHIDQVYRFLDRLTATHKQQVEKIAVNHARRLAGGKLQVVFYDMTTLYFEISDEDDLRKIGFSKDGKSQTPQIFLGLLVSGDGFAIGYDIFEGNIYEAHTLLPFLKNIEERFTLGKPVVVADAGLLSSANLLQLEANGYEYILGARIKNESKQVKEKIQAWVADKTSALVIDKQAGRKLIVAYSEKRRDKDLQNRQRGLRRVEKSILTGKLTKKNINNRGYNKYLKIKDEVKVEIDREKFESDQLWDGLKGYLTNTRLTSKEIIEHYNGLWQIEKAFRMSKTDLKIRPIYHRLQDRIQAHICIAFTAYCVYKELERLLKQANSTLSVAKAAEITHTMYQVSYMLPKSKHLKTTLLKMSAEQEELLTIVRNSTG